MTVRQKVRVYALKTHKKLFMKIQREDATPTPRRGRMDNIKCILKAGSFGVDCFRERQLANCC